MPIPHAELEEIKHKISIWKYEQEQRKAALPWCVRFWRWLKMPRWQDYCGRCQKVVRWKMTLHRLDHDRPPLFGTYTCPGCGLSISSSPFNGWDQLTTAMEREEAEASFADWVNT